uniref:Putative capsid morphogenesis protein n=1 Tax=viral metagenome TaxID=1070528 RepID=A0A6M3L0S7_9ZZZZ
MPKQKQSKIDTRLPVIKRQDATGTGGLRRSYQSNIYSLFNTYAEKLKPRINRLLNRVGNQGFIKEFLEKLDDTQNVVINAGAPKIINEHITRSYTRGKQVAANNPRLRRDTILIDSKLSRTDNMALEDLKTRNFILIKNAGETMKNRLLQTMTEDIRQGKSIEEMAKHIQENIVDIGRSKSRTIARTEIAYSYNSAIAKTYQDANIERWQWLSALGYSTCQECMSKHGNIYNWDDEQPPIHPNCLCTIYPIIERET